MKISKGWQNIIIWLVCFSVLWLVFAFFSSLFLDPDFGWHLKTGEWVWLNRAVPKTDLFSYTMPDYPWVAHAWSIDALFFLGLETIGYQGLAVMAGLIGALTFMILIRLKDIIYFLFPLALVCLSSVDYINVRPRMIGFLSAVVLFQVLKKSFKKPFWLIFLPLIFWFWVNSHASFSLGVFLVLGAVFLDGFFVWQKKPGAKKHLWLAALSLVLSIFLSLVNPYGKEIYRLVFEEMVLGQQVHYRISEWLPYASFNLAMMVYTSLFLALTIIFLPFKLPGFADVPLLSGQKKNDRKVFWSRARLFELVIACAFLAAGFMSRRLIVFFYFFSLSLSVDYYRRTYELLKTQKKFKQFRKWGLVFLLFFSVYALGFLVNFYRRSKAYSEKNFYPMAAVEHIKSEPLAGNMYSHYNWGGYLIWKLPEKKVFVDGRMAIWRQNDYSAFLQQVEIETGEVDYQPIFEKYQISHILIPAKNSRRLPLIHFVLEIFGLKKNSLTLKEKLFVDGWQVVYGDEVAQILVQP